MMRKGPTVLDELLGHGANERAFAAEELTAEASELIATLMHRQGITKAELAKRLGKSRPYVTQLLATGRNMTMHSLADVAYVLGARVQLQTVALTRKKAAGRRGKDGRRKSAA